MKREKMKSEKKIKKCYVNVAASFSENSFENMLEHLRLFRSGLDRFPACASRETDFFDGTVLSFLELGEPSLSDELKGSCALSAFVMSCSTSLSTTLLSLHVL